VHVLGRFTRFDTDAARLGADLLARQKSGAGEPVAADGAGAARLVTEALTEASALALMDAGLADDLSYKSGQTSGHKAPRAEPGPGGRADHLISSSGVLRQALRGTSTGAAVQISLKLGITLVGLGASAATHYPAIAEGLGAELVVPEHADVAGAVGAAAGTVRQRVLVLVTQPSDGVFRVHLADGPKDVKTQDEAVTLARNAAEAGAKARAAAAGASGDLRLTLHEEIDDVPVGPDKRLFLQAVVTAEASAQ